MKHPFSREGENHAFPIARANAKGETRKDESRERGRRSDDGGEDEEITLHSATTRGRKNRDDESQMPLPTAAAAELIDSRRG